jgi:hypothetical protein
VRTGTLAWRAARLGLAALLLVALGRVACAAELPPLSETFAEDVLAVAISVGREAALIRVLHHGRLHVEIRLRRP